MSHMIIFIALRNKENENGVWKENPMSNDQLFFSST